MVNSVVIEYFTGGGKWGPIGVNLRVMSRWSIYIPENFVVVRAVFIILI